MNRDSSEIPQAKSFAVRLDWRPLDQDDRAALQRDPKAVFLLRSWREADDEFGHQWAGVCEGMATITIVFRAGCRLVGQYTRSFGDPLKRALWDAEEILTQRPNLSEIVS